MCHYDTRGSFILPTVHNVQGMMCPLLEESSALEGLWFNLSYDYVVLMPSDNRRVFYLGQCSYRPKEAKWIYNSGYTVQDTYGIHSPSRSSVGRVLDSR